MFEDFEVIDVYIRQQAIEDGVLIDVTTQAKEAGIRFPVALTSALFESLNPTDEDSKHGSYQVMACPMVKQWPKAEKLFYQGYVWAWRQCRTCFDFHVTE